MILIQTYSIELVEYVYTFMVIMFSFDNRYCNLLILGVFPGVAHLGQEDIKFILSIINC